MPIGIITNASAILLGGIIGGIFGKHFPERIRTNLTFIFGVASMAIGINLIVKLHSLPSIVLSVILGTFIGEMIDLEHWMEVFTVKIKLFIEKISGKNSSEDDMFIQKYVSLVVLFCTGSTGILGSMAEAMTGDHSILLAKAVLDIFTSAIFAASLGFLVAGIAVPQFLFFMALYLLSGFILPLTAPEALNDFMSCGGIIALATGFRICDMKYIRITNMLPSLLIVIPISKLWGMFF